MNEELYAIVEDGANKIYRDSDSGDRAYIYENWTYCKCMCKKLNESFFSQKQKSFHVVTLKIEEVEE